MRSTAIQDTPCGSSPCRNPSAGSVEFRLLLHDDQHRMFPRPLSRALAADKSVACPLLRAVVLCLEPQHHAMNGSRLFDLRLGDWCDVEHFPSGSRLDVELLRGVGVRFRLFPPWRLLGEIFENFVRCNLARPLAAAGFARIARQNKPS